ncbi:GNAT family N-acetyltransferase [Cloacibacillus sp.]|nr:GNAT family N-acetyltransferase [Cloacibacillus sp.]
MSQTAAVKAKEYLSRDALSHIDMLEAIDRGRADILYAERGGVILIERESQSCMISVDEISICEALPSLGSFPQYAAHQRDVAAYIARERTFPYSLTVRQAAYLKKEPPCVSEADIRPLTDEFTETVFLNYEAMDDPAYIRELISRGQMWGIFKDGLLAGFIGEHLEGSMGLLEVLPEHRGRGYGYALESFLIGRTLARGSIPFCQVVTGNRPSLALQKKLGMAISKGKTYWLFN